MSRFQWASFKWEFSRPHGRLWHGNLLFQVIFLQVFCACGLPASPLFPALEHSCIKQYSCGQNNDKPSSSHHHFYRWYGFHSQSRVVYDIVLTTWMVIPGSSCFTHMMFPTVSAASWLPAARARKKTENGGAASVPVSRKNRCQSLRFNLSLLGNSAQLELEEHRNCFFLHVFPRGKKYGAVSGVRSSSKSINGMIISAAWLDNWGPEMETSTNPCSYGPKYQLNIIKKYKQNPIERTIP